MKECRPRLTDDELGYLVKVLKDREQVYKELYARQVRTVVLRTIENDRLGILPHNWGNTVFHNFDLHGKEVLICFRQLASEVKANQTVFEHLNNEILVAKGLGLRLEKLLNGKRKGRLNVASDLARNILNEKRG